LLRQQVPVSPRPGLLFWPRPTIWAKSPRRLTDRRRSSGSGT